MHWLFNVIVCLAGFIVVAVFFLQLDCMCGTLFGAVVVVSHCCC